MSLLQSSQVASLQPVKFILNWGRRYSLWLLNFGLACCGIELIAASMSKHDFIRFGVIPVAHGPRQADLLIIAGTVTDKMVPPLKRIYEQMPEPKYVISFGSCANVGGPYWDSYSVTKGVDQIMPVDVFVPGCPPRPEALLDGIIMLQRKIADEEIGEVGGVAMRPPGELVARDDGVDDPEVIHRSMTPGWAAATGRPASTPNGYLQ
jgi:NADH-quinone oxidoreductase subunit B